MNLIRQNRIEEEGLNHSFYSHARQALIRAIGSKGAHEYNKREYERLGETGRKLQAEANKKWEQDWEETRRVEEQKRLEDMEAGAYFLNSHLKMLLNYTVFWLII